MAIPLHPFQTHLQKQLPKFNLDDGLPAEEHIKRLFTYALQGSARSWYFSIPSGSINSWDFFQEKFLTKFPDDSSTTTIINDLANLKVIE